MKRNKDDECGIWSHKNDFPLEEVWNTNHEIAKLTVPRLKAFRALEKHGHPAEFSTVREWNAALDKMIYAFELSMYPGGPDLEHQNDYEIGMSLFCRFFQYLWD